MLEWIVSSCLVILAVLLLRTALGKRISANLRYALWALVLFRLLVPVQLFTSSLAGLQVEYAAPEILREESLYVLPIQSMPLEDAENISIREDGALLDANSFGYARLEDETVRRYAARISPLEALQGIWLAGALLFGMVLLLSNLRFSARLRRVRRPLELSGSPIPVYAADGLPSPCLFGFFRPAVYVGPRTAQDPVMLRHIKAHELTHYRHLDHLWSVLRGVALAVHWWNPLVWLAVFLSRRDGELACDESAIRRLGDGERRAYGETLLSLVTVRPGPRDLLSFATTMSGGKKNLQERIRRIACKQKVLVSASVVVVFCLLLVFLTAFGRKITAPEDSSAPDRAFSEVDRTVELDRLESEAQRLQVLRRDGELPEWELSVARGTRDGALKAIWSVTLDESHSGCGTYFLYRRDGQDYLLEYMPEIQQGSCTYSYRLFHLENGEEVTDQENRVKFDINFGSASHQFDPAAITSFMTEVNGLIGESELLVNTNHWMLNLEEDGDGRLRDNILTALNYRDSQDFRTAGDLYACLMDYVSYGVDHPDDVNSPLNDLLASLEPEDLDGASAQLFPLLREAASKRLSRFHEYSTFGEEEAWTWSTAELSFPVREGGTLYLLACDSGNLELAYETAEGCTSAFYESKELYDLICETGRAYPAEELPYTADLDHDGTPDRLTLRGSGRQEGTAWLLQCAYENGAQVWSAYGNTSHAGWNAVFLCRLDGQDYLLQYNPSMGSGICVYEYELFYLEKGEQVAVQEGIIEFDLLFARDHQRFEPIEINAFMEEINTLLANSTQLLNTDGSLLDTFEREGRLYDSLWWLDEDFSRDEDKTLLENLIAYKNQGIADGAVPTPRDVFQEITAEDILATGSTDVSAEELAAALNAFPLALAHVEGWEAQRPAVQVRYTRMGDTGEQAMLLEAGAAGERELVRMTLSGQATAVQYSENPEVDGTYLRDVPYSYSVFVEDEAFYELVCRMN